MTFVGIYPLFGGANIPAHHALFDMADYDGPIISDLFDEACYFGDAATFWPLQNNAIAEAREHYLADGWADVVILDVGEYFPAYDYVATDKAHGGKVYVAISRDGEVTFYEGQLSRYEGQLSRKEAKARLKAKKNKANNGKENEEGQSVTTKPELTQTMQNYLDLHRHSAVRSVLLQNNAVALRLAVAQMIAGSSLWDIKAEPQKAHSQAIQDSLSGNKAEADFAKARQRVLTLLRIDQQHDSDTLVYRKNDWGKRHDLHAIFSRLMALDDHEVSVVLAFVVAETLPCGEALVEGLGYLLNVDMQAHWQPRIRCFLICCVINRRSMPC